LTRFDAAVRLLGVAAVLGPILESEVEVEVESSSRSFSILAFEARRLDFRAGVFGAE